LLWPWTCEHGDVSAHDKFHVDNGRGAYRNSLPCDWLTYIYPACTVRRDAHNHHRLFEPAAEKTNKQHASQAPRAASAASTLGRNSLASMTHGAIPSSLHNLLLSRISFVQHSSAPRPFDAAKVEHPIYIYSCWKH